MTFLRLVRRHVNPGGALVAAGFFLLVAVLTAFAAGPDSQLLQRIGPGILWVAALLASLLPVGTVFAPALENGTLDQLRVSGLAYETIAAARIASLWLSFAPPLLLAAMAAGVLLQAPIQPLLAGLLLGTPALAALGVLAAALVAGARGGEAIAGLIVLPLALPILIFGAGEAYRLLAAASLFAVFTAPFAAAAALRAAD